ncbi:YlbD family protein [Bacillus sp. 2205SS5-2]|uniref:YlbD family protein n=1 Tax=Bacillus sp. 2205SS5-2 TaxID=3109031 RepID=UPI003005C977
MGKKELHPSVLEFKKFVQNHPSLAKEVHSGRSTWQELFEDWYLFGEEDPKWDPFKKEGSSENQAKEKNENKGLMDQLSGILQKMEPDQIQNHISNLSQALGAIQGVLTQFSSSNSSSTQVKTEPKSRPNPFSFNKD